LCIACLNPFFFYYKIPNGFYKDVDLFADLAAEKPIAAERQGQKIVVEVKSFLSSSPMRDFELALFSIEI